MTQIGKFQILYPMKASNQITRPFGALLAFTIFATSAVRANEVTWNGGAGGSWDWSQGANWAGGSAPEVDNNSIIHFAGTGSTTGGNAWNNLGWWHSYNQIIFDSGASSFTIQGDEVTLAPNGAITSKIVNNSSNGQTIKFYAMALRGGTEITAAGGDITFDVNGSDPIWIDPPGSGNAIIINGGGGHAVVFNKRIADGSGANGAIVLDANNTLKLVGNNTYSGGTTLNNGVVEVQSNTSFGTGAVHVNSSSWVSIQGNSTVSNAITLNGGTLGWHYTSGDGVYSGPVNLTANSTVSLANYYGYGSVSGTISGNISGSSGLTVNNTDRGGTAQTGGTLTLSGTNTYTGTTTLSAGTMVLSSTGRLSGTSVDVASGATLNLALGSIYTLKIDGLTATQITGSGTASLDGHFAFDLAAAGTVSGTIWQVVANSTLAETYGVNFTVDTFSNAGGGLWTKVVGANTYSFDQGLGQLSVVPEPATWILLSIGVGGAIALRRRRVK